MPFLLDTGDLPSLFVCIMTAWQPVPSLLIIMGAFNVTAGLMWGIHRLAYGTVRKNGIVDLAVADQES